MVVTKYWHVCFRNEKSQIQNTTQTLNNYLTTGSRLSTTDQVQTW